MNGGKDGKIKDADARLSKGTGSGRYDDIIDLPAYRLRHHAPMSTASRAAQFLPFDALDGYSDAVTETARETTEKPELDADELAALDAELSKIAAALERGASDGGEVVGTSALHEGHIPSDGDTLTVTPAAKASPQKDERSLPTVEAAYFVPDEMKEGGRIVYKTGRVKAIDDVSKMLIFEDGTAVSAENVIALSMADDAF